MGQYTKNIDGVTYTIQGDKLIKADNYYLPSDLIIQNGVDVISSRAFFRCDKLKTLKLPRFGVKYIEAWAFKDCTSLQSVEFSLHTELIGKGAFENCSSLKRIEIPSCVHAIESEAFRGCTSLEYVKIPESVQYIGEDAFRGCEKLKEVVVEGGVYYSQYDYIYNYKGVKYIANGAFMNCKALTKLCLPASLSLIGGLAFSGTALKQLYFKNPKVLNVSHFCEYQMLGGWGKTICKDTDLSKCNLYVADGQKSEINPDLISRFKNIVEE